MLSYTHTRIWDIISVSMHSKRSGSSRIMIIMMMMVVWGSTVSCNFLWSHIYSTVVQSLLTKVTQAYYTHTHTHVVRKDPSTQNDYYTYVHVVRVRSMREWRAHKNNVLISDKEYMYMVESTLWRWQKWKDWSILKLSFCWWCQTTHTKKSRIIFSSFVFVLAFPSSNDWLTAREKNSFTPWEFQ